MNSTDFNISMVKGDTLSFGIEIEGLDQDLDSAFFSCAGAQPTTEYVFQKSLGDGITKVETGKYRVRVAPEDTADAEAGFYFYDLQIGVNSDIFTIMKGSLCLEAEVTVPEV